VQIFVIANRLQSCLTLPYKVSVLFNVGFQPG